MDRILAQFRLLDFAGYLAPGVVFICFAWKFVHAALDDVLVFAKEQPAMMSVLLFINAYAIGFLLSYSMEELLRRVRRVLRSKSERELPESSGDLFYRRVFADTEQAIEKHLGVGARAYSKSETLDVAEYIAKRAGLSDEVERGRAISRFAHGIAAACLVTAFLHVTVGWFVHVSFVELFLSFVGFAVVGGVAVWTCLEDDTARVNETMVACLVAINGPNKQVVGQAD